MSLSPQKYFKDYEVVDRLDENGNFVRELEYRGDFYTRNMDADEHRKQKWSVLMLCLLADAFFIVGATQNVTSTRSGFSAALALGLIIPLFFMTLGGIHNFSPKQKLSVNEYKGVSSFLRMGGRITACLGALNTVVHSIVWAYYGIAAEQTTGLFCIAGFLFMAVVAFLIYRMDKGVIYTLVTVKAPDGADKG